MEASDAENLDSKIKMVKIDFAKLINNIESQCQKTLLTRKNQLLQKQQQKQNWLSRSKIIPPTFPKFASTEQPENTLKTSTFYENMFSDDGKVRIKNRPYRCEQSIQRNQCKTSYGNARKAAQCKRTKSNWKLQFRKDQLNVLKYKYIRSQLEEINTENATKDFKLRKVFKKLQDAPPDAYFSKGGFIDTLDTKENPINTLKTIEVYGQLRQRIFID